MNQTSLSVNTVFMLIIVILASCRTIKDHQDNNTMNLAEVLNDDPERYDCISNQSGSHILCMNKKEKLRSNLNSNNELHTILIADIRSGNILLKEKVRGGMGKWIDDRNIELYYPAGIPGKEKIKVFNLDTGQKEELIKR